MVLGKQIIDSMYKLRAVRKVEEAVYDSCSNGSDHIRLNVSEKMMFNSNTIDLSILYLELILTLDPIHYEFFENTLLNGDKEKWLLVQLDVKNEIVRLCYAKQLEREFYKEAESIRKNPSSVSEYLLFTHVNKWHSFMSLDELNKKELRRLVDDYDESIELYKFRKAHKMSFKKFRLLVKDYLRNEI